MKLKINEGSLNSVIKTADKVAKTLSEDILFKWKSNIEEDGHVDTGEYKDSISVERIDKGNYRVFSEAKYAIFVEYGTGPAVGKPSYVPPFDKILEWVESKLGYSGNEAKAVAWAIVRKIETEGIAPTRSARNAMDYVLGTALNNAKEIFKKELK